VALARRLLAANLSDLAAMGARPRAALLTLGAPPGTERVWLEAFFAALRDACAANECWLAGGDVVRDASLHLNLFLLGEVETENILLMSGGAPGDDLWTTGTLGDSAAGLLALRHEEETGDAAAWLAEVYREGRHRWREMRQVLAVATPTAATDNSDGLATDLPRLCRACGCGAEIELCLLPTSSAFQSLTSKLGCGSLSLCLSGGEDFEVLLSATPDDRTALEALNATVRWLDENGKEWGDDVRGYDHFRGTL
jgi:thiamine-monophosphate kinase